MLLAWVRTVLVSNMLLAEAYGAGGCFWDNGHLYRADQPSPAPGLRCLKTPSQAPPAPGTEEEEVSEAPQEDEAQAFPPANALPARSEAAAVQPVIGISQRVRVNPKEKKDLGTLGHVLGITMMVIIIAIGVGIVLGYTYKRGKDLRAQREQKACEREMQRVTLPLSAFANPTCEIVDEKTVAGHPSQTPLDFQEGSAPLMDQAGTPGA
ncbi:phosphoinositide-3-kinase-interacting protein 1 [Echinops telfairi]|uniref:Phosphoinositide-3-kinase-interacting protein 1 n=1 Tax=Echinops telfairi TaxID=9371 RepID=A0AC55D174_ECHTE|nr:phosphoinositide-3-kinase-interacting protein 1 [Echinops telfairi]